MMNKYLTNEHANKILQTLKNHHTSSGQLSSRFFKIFIYTIRCKIFKMALLLTQDIFNV